MFKLNGSVERETEKAVLFSATVLYTGSVRNGSRASVWFPKSRIEKIEADALIIADENEWLLSAKEREANGQWVFVPLAVN
jgi:hypothetical protein